MRVIRPSCVCGKKLIIRNPGNQEIQYLAPECLLRISGCGHSGGDGVMHGEEFRQARDIE